MRRDRRLTPSLTNNTHKQSIVNGFLYIAHYTSHIRIKIVSVLIEYTRYSQTKDGSLVRDLLHDLSSWNLKSSVFWDITPCSPLKVNRRTGETCRLHLQGPRISQARNQREAGGKQSNQLANISDYIGNRREMEERNSVPVGSPVGQNETASTHCLSHNNRAHQ
jgi:hypothetical protein